jgi:hypothetical protein
MKTWHAAMLLSACVLTGCQTPKAMHTSGGDAPQSTRNNSYSLLHQLLDDEKNVSLLHFIKPENPDVKKMVKRIATTSAAGATLLEQFAKDDPTIRLDDISLPPGEAATRDAIASTKEKELLSQTGDRFELTLLLTQTEALSYGWHLALVTSLYEPDPDRAHALVGIGVDMDNLYHEVFEMLLEKTRASATNSIGISAAPAVTNSASTNLTLMIDPSSIPVDAGKATLTIGALQRVGGVCTGDYKVTVFPYFLKNEKGTLAIVVSDESLAKINQGMVVAITGTATTSGKGERSRPIQAMATPTDINHGNLKLWFMAGGRKMIFETAYHFAGTDTTAVIAGAIAIRP